MFRRGIRKPVKAHGVFTMGTSATQSTSIVMWFRESYGQK